MVESNNIQFEAYPMVWRNPVSRPPLQYLAIGAPRFVWREDE